jgi:ABC-type oligopeptide transport system substrate-binding subunit
MKFAPLVLTTTSDYLDMAVFLQNAWKQIGLDVAIEIQTGGMLRQLRNAGKLGMFRGSWIADYPDAENYLACFYSPYKAPNGPNYTHYDSKYFDQLFEEVAFAKVENEADVQRRNRLAQKANALTFDDAPVIVLYYDKSVRLMQKNVSGLGNDPINRLDLRYVRKR